jgi:hypothetical protein
MKKLLPLFFILSAFMSCSKDNVPQSGTYIGAVAEISFLNQNQEDLLDTLTPGSFAFDDMRLYYLKHDKKVEVYDPHMDAPRSLRLIKATPNRLWIGFSTDTVEGVIGEKDGNKIGVSIAYLQLSDAVTDTIKTEWESQSGNFYITKVWYNGELLGQPGSTPFKVIKNQE